MTRENRDWDNLAHEALLKLQNGEDLTGKNGAMTALAKALIEASLEGELDAHLEEASGNRRNGKTGKQLKTGHGTIELSTSRDRNGSFEPELVKKRQTTLGKGLDNKIIALYARGMSYQDICDHLEDLYGTSVSESSLTAITDKVIPVVKEWQSRPLEAIYPVVWLDAIHYKVREDGRILTKAVYCILGVNLSGKKGLLGMYLAERESASFWLSVLTELQNRGIEDIFIACIDNLSGFKEAISSIFPKTEVQLCVVHQVRNTLKYIAHRDQKIFIRDLKQVYKATTQDLAESHLLELDEKWGKKYPIVLKSWHHNWTELSAYFKYPAPVRRIIYTNNTIESFHSQLRKVTKTKRVFSSDMALLKLLYLVQENITAKWTMPMADWKNSLSQFSIIFEDRIKLDITF